MHNWLDEFFIIITQSKKIVIAFFLGLLIFVVVNLIGYFQLVDFELSSSLRGVEQVIKKVLYERYSAAAFIALISFWSLAIKLYFKEKKRLFN